MRAFHMDEMAKAKAEFLGFMVLAGSAANCGELLRRRELFGNGARGGQKGLDWGLDNCKRQLDCLFKADEILNRLISGHKRTPEGWMKKGMIEPMISRHGGSFLRKRPGL
jgi:hypothetical protein